MSEADALAGAVRRLERPGAWLAADGEGYVVRVGADRRRRAAGRLTEADFRALAAEPGLRSRPDGGWTLRPRPASPPKPPAGRPGFIAGERAVAEPGGGMAVRAVNLGESPIAWLAHRRDANGRPWLTPAEAASGERLRDDFYRAGIVGRLTMDWDAGPRSGGRSPAALDPAERGLAAKARVSAALDAAGPGLKEMLERVCLAGMTLEAAERALGLPRRAGKAVLKLALGRLAVHYGVGP